MQDLTKLELHAPEGEDILPFVECMEFLTGLKSLVFLDSIPTVVSPQITQRLSIFTQLTQLSLDATPGNHPLRFPKGIVDLGLKTQQSFPTDLLTELVDLTRLEYLCIHSAKEMHLFHTTGVTPFHFFRKLRKLKALTLWNACLDRAFLSAFVALTGLTKLRLGGRKTQMDHSLVCKQLSLLSNLRVLEIPFPERLIDSISGVPQGGLPKLRTIDLPLCRTVDPPLYHTIDAKTHASLFDAFPCLRNVNTRGRTLNSV